MSGAKPLHAFTKATRQSRKRDLDEFAADLQTTVNKALPLNFVGYRQVAVLSFTWANDTMGVKTTEEELLQVFQNSYGFTVERFTIRTDWTKPQALNALQNQIFKFGEDWGAEDSLLIYVYSGHGALVGGGNTMEYLIAGQADKNGLVGPSIDWISISSGIKHQKGDILYIFDSCFAGQLAIGAGPELLAVANYSSVAGSFLDTSFTRILATELKKLDGNPCSVAHLFSKIHRDTLVNNIAQVPLHVLHPTKNSIVLQKLEKVPEMKTSKRVKTMQIEALKGSETRVLITVRIKDSAGLPDLIGWKNWLAKNIPPSVDPSQITIEGQFDIGSSLLLITLPVAIWTMLPSDDTAYGFVSYVKSGNRLLQQVGPLATRSYPAGRENRPQSFDSSYKGTSSGGFGGFGSGSGTQR